MMIILQSRLKTSWEIYVSFVHRVIVIHAFSVSSYTAIQNFSVFQLMRWGMNHITIQNRSLAHRLCKLIPAHCPFERNIQLFRYTFHIPPLCKLNPLYEELMALRFRALSYLVDECGEDITRYCTLSNR